MRNFPFISVRKIINELKAEGLDISRTTLYRREEEIAGFPKVQNGPKDWRRYSREEADLVKKLLKEHYKIS